MISSSVSGAVSKDLAFDNDDQKFSLTRDGRVTYDVPSTSEEDSSLVAYSSFDDMPLSAELLHGIYSYGFEKPSVIQQKAIVPLSQGKDVIAMAQSGTGKTGAFSIGVLQRLDPKLKAPQALIMEPVRELATQTRNVMGHMGDYLGIKVYLCTGGSAGDHMALRSSQAIVATPGRACDLIQRKVLSLKDLKVIILDEADQMLSEGFGDDIRFIFSQVPREAQVGLFSATMPPAALELTSKFMRDPLKILIQKEDTSLQGIRQFYVDVGKENDKLGTLMDIFSEVSVSQCIIFSNTRRKAEWLAKTMDDKEYSVSLLHGEMDPATRNKLMDDFRVGRTRVLITTDLLARGIDVQGISCVINFDLTEDLEKYIHRIGRAGRFGRKGVAISFVSERDNFLIQKLTHFYSLEIKELPANFADYMAA